MKGFTFDLQRFAEYTFTYDAEATDGNKYILNGTGYATPTDAFNTLSDGDTVKLESDVEHTINSYVLIQGANLEKDGRGVVTKYDPRTITLDLNGHKWTRTAKGNYVFRLSSGGHLVVEDSSEAKTGEIAVAEDIVGKATSSVIYVANGGSFTLNSGKIVNYGNDGNDAGKYAVYGINVNTDAVNITINGGSVETPNNTGEKNKAILGNGSVDCTTITVNEGAKITSGSYGIEIIKANLVVNGGTIESTGDKAAIGVLNSTSTATISGGTIKSAKGVAVNFATPNGSLNISGGTIDGGIIVNEKSTLDIAADYTGLIKSPVTVDGTTKYYTTDEWAQVKDTLEEKTIDQTTQYYTEDGWAQRESNVLVPTLFKNSTNGTTTVTFAEGDNFVEGTNLIEAKLNGKVQYFTTVDKCKALLSICNEETLDGETGYYSSNVFNALEKVTVTYDGKYPTYFTPAYWENLKGSLLTAEINGATKYFTTEAKLTSTVKTYIAITVDDTTKYYTTQTLADAAIDGKIAVLIDDETQYFTSADTLAAAVAKHNYITVIIDDTTKYYSGRGSQRQNRNRNRRHDQIFHRRSTGSKSFGQRRNRNRRRHDQIFHEQRHFGGGH